MHICLDYIAELVSQPCIAKQVFAVQLLSYLSVQYSLPKSMSVAHLTINTLISLLGVLDSQARNKLFSPVLPCLVRIAIAFPPLIEDIIVLLTQLTRVALSQASLASHVDARSAYADEMSYENPMMLCETARKTFKDILTNAVLKTTIY